MSKDKYSKCIDCVHAKSKDCLGLRECIFDIDIVEEEVEDTIKRFELKELEAARLYARENNKYICLYIVKGYIECKELSEEEIRYIACDMLLDSKGNVIYNSLLRIEVEHERF